MADEKLNTGPGSEKLPDTPKGAPESAATVEALSEIKGYQPYARRIF